MLLPAEFFELNLAFARRVAALTGLSLAEALRGFTYIYLSFNLPRDFDAAHPVWRAYLAGLEVAGDPAGWTAGFYRQRQLEAPKPLPELEFGCFSYSEWDGGRMRIHFRANDAFGISPLSRERLPVRLEELAGLFRHIRSHAAHLTSVVGGSWLYHLPAYRRLFPPAFLASAAVGEGDAQFFTLWGQFIDHTGQVKPALAQEFHQALENQTSLAGLLACFPYSVLRVEGPVEAFYAFYGV